MGDMTGSRFAPACVTQYWQAVSNRDASRIPDIVTSDFTEDWPQSGEQIRGSQAWARVVDGHPTYPAVSVRRIVGVDDLWVCEADFDYRDGAPWRICAVMELSGQGVPRITRITQYFGPPFPAAAWRSGITDSIGS